MGRGGILSSSLTRKFETKREYSGLPNFGKKQRHGLMSILSGGGKDGLSGKGGGKLGGVERRSLAPYDKVRSHG